MQILHRPGHDGTLALAVRTGTPVASPAVSGAAHRRPPVLLVHGMGGDHRTWRRTAAMLTRAGRRVYAVDLRGHGRSGRAGSYLLDDFAEDIAFVVDAQGLDRVDVVAHSLGAQAALRFAMNHPERVGRLVLEEIPPMPREQAHLDEGITVDSGLAERLRGVLSMVRDPSPLLRFDRRVAAAVPAQFEVAAPQWWERLTQVRASALVISGGRRSFLPPRHLEELARAMAGAAFTTIDAGHSVHRDQPVRFSRVLSDFLDL